MPGALLAVLVQNAIFAAASKAIASMGVAAASGRSNCSNGACFR